MKRYVCPHCGGNAKKVNTAVGEMIICDGDKQCQFTGTEDEFEVYEDE
jgi:ssDNA-binding Zn-finger/Zn-ribbon topoisomerase 1